MQPTRLVGKKQRLVGVRYPRRGEGLAPHRDRVIQVGRLTSGVVAIVKPVGLIGQVCAPGDVGNW